MHRLLMVPVLVTLASCGSPPPIPLLQPHYSADIGVPGVTLEPGQLAGTWAMQVEFATIINLPLFGNRNSGSNGGRLGQISWDGSSYHLSMTWCWDEVFEVEGTRNNFADDRLALIAPVEGGPTVQDDIGDFHSGDLLDLWGLHNMPDPVNSPMPTDQNHTNPPQSDWVFDEDQDGHTAVTSNVSGSINGEAYLINRALFALKGVARTTNELLGLVEQRKIEQTILESTIQLPGGSQTGASDLRADPNPKASWFQAVRIGDGLGCNEVRAARDDERLSRRRPF